jgi:hypothetical protein
LRKIKVFMSGMITTKDDLSRWFDEGLAQGATHLIVVCNTFSDEDYALYVEACEDVHIVVNAHDGVNWQEVIEVFNLSVDKNTQLAQERALNY